MSLNKDILDIYPTFADAEKSILGKRTNGLWAKMNRSDNIFVEWKNFLWVKLNDLNKFRKVEDELRLAQMSNNK